MSRLSIVLPSIALAACTTGEPLDTTASALTVEQCTYFAELGEGTVTICHETSSARNPFVIIRTDEEGCINGHEDHAGDMVSLDGSCVEGCFPPGAPIDTSRGEKCCEGAVAVEGWCTEACVPNQCQKEGKFDVERGECVYANYEEGTACDDGDACTSDDYCDGRGTCTSKGEDKCGCAADAQWKTDEHYATCTSAGTPVEQCLEEGRKVYHSYYQESGCTEEPTKWQEPGVK